MKNNNKIKTKEFRLRGKKFFLTYPQLDTSIEFLKEEALEQLKLKIKHIRYYLIGEENHEDGGKHLHCFFELKTSLEINKSDYFDLILNGINYHGNYQIGKRKKQLIEYIIKEDNFITNMVLPIKNGELMKPTEHLMEVCKEEGFHKAKDLLYEGYPHIAAGRGGTIMKNLAEFSDYTIQKESFNIQNENIFVIGDYDFLTEEQKDTISSWLLQGTTNGFSVTLVLYGPGGTGKTQLAKTLFKSLNIEPLIVSEINDFKFYDSSKHKGLLIDDLDAESLSRVETLNIIDSGEGRSIRILYGIVSPSPKIPRIITTNSLEDFTKDGAEELLRRLNMIYIPKILSSKFNVNININNLNILNNNSYYFGQTLGIPKEVHENLLKEKQERDSKKQLEKNKDLSKIITK